jgi:amino acid adenylation domain-containing protein
VAAEDRERRLTFKQMRSAALNCAARLTCDGVIPGDRVVLYMSNSVAFCVAFWGIVYSGGVVVPLNPGTKLARLAWIFGDCTPAAVICDRDLAETAWEARAQASLDAAIVLSSEVGEPTRLIDEAGEIQADASVWPSVLDQDLAAIIYTSGSTGSPKGVMLSHLNMTSAARSVSQYLDYQPSDSVFCCIPMTFDYGLHQLTITTLVGARLLVEPSFAQPLFALQRLARSGASVFPLVPTMVPLIAPLADRFDLSSVRLITSTAAVLHGTLIDKLIDLFPGARLFSMYGLTECHRCSYLDPAELSRRRTSVGKAIPNTELWVVDAAGQAHRRNAIGELVIRGSTVMKGYWKNPGKTAEKLRPGPFSGERVLFTGDTCRLDEDGFLYFISRSDDILKVAGEKVAPSEIDAALIAHPAVAEVCAFGIEHPVYGQQCVAAVVLQPAEDVLAEVDLKAWCAARLEPHVVPAKIWIADAMPRSGNGKIDRHALRERFVARGTAPIEGVGTAVPA